MTRNERLRELAEDAKKKRQASREADASFREHTAPGHPFPSETFGAWDTRRHELAETCRTARRAKEAAVEALRGEIDEDTVLELLGTSAVPVIDDFIAGVTTEAAHQRQRWGTSHDAIKGPEDWFWTLSYLAGKALRAAIEGDAEKALHHCVSSAALLANWHSALLTEHAEARRHELQG